MTESRIGAIFAEASAVHLATATHSGRAILHAVQLMREALGRGRKIFVFGNGGSAADSQHFAAELVGRFQLERRPLPAIALTTDTSVLTSIANDFAYEEVFARQIEALGAKGDVAFGITTSGRSPNVLAGWRVARKLQLTTIGLVGSETAALVKLVDAVVPIPGSITARVQEAHRTALHAICELIEEDVRGTHTMPSHSPEEWEHESE